MKKLTKLPPVLFSLSFILLLAFYSTALGGVEVGNSKSDLYILSIGINKYPKSGLSNLAFATSDAEAIASEFERRAGNTVSSVHKFVFLDEQAYRKGILDVLEKWPCPKINISNRVRNGYVSRETLLQTGRAWRMLVEVFSNLPNLRKVGLRDYNGAGRIRDGEDARWRSWGWSLCSPSHTGWSSPAIIFPMLISALAQANARPSNVEVFLRRSQQLTPE